MTNNGGKRRGAGGIIYDPHKNLILLVQGKATMKWGPPKGHFNPDEIDPMKVALREIQEETGLNLCIENLGNVVLNKHGYRLYDVPISSELHKIEINDHEEINDCKWFKLDEFLDIEERFMNRFLKTIKNKRIFQ